MSLNRQHLSEIVKEVSYASVKVVIIVVAVVAFAETKIKTKLLFAMPHTLPTVTTKMP